MALILRLRCLLCALLVMAAVPAAGQDRDPEGLWALRADGQILALLDCAAVLERPAPGRENGQAGDFTIDQSNGSPK